MQSIWETYPTTYRQKEIAEISYAVQGGNCVSVVGLSGSGKSNLLGFLYHRKNKDNNYFWIDGNRAALSSDANDLLHLIIKALGNSENTSDPLENILNLISDQVERCSTPICLIIDRFDAFQDEQAKTIASQLRYLRDTFKYQLTYILGTRTPIDHENEIAELCYAHTIYLGALSKADALWSVQSYTARNQLTWDDTVTEKIIDASGAYPSFMRAACEAVAAGCIPDANQLLQNSAVLRRLEEFKHSQTTPDLLEKSGLTDHPWIQSSQPGMDTEQLTAQEFRLLSALQANSAELCTKDELIQAIWPEDKIYGQGLRDDSLAQLVRRLRTKIEPDPSNPQKIQTVPGRGYIWRV
ncbi:MAG: winged helix-turn-helix domain-containing protein [Anaerolineaceae bacterium]|nr:winged helix-turn-helix domain-containing protein [Anaerolineaceae bacterium]